MRLAIAVFVLFTAGAAFGQNSASPANHSYIRFTFENPQLEPAAYSLEIYEDGTGSYSATLGSDSGAQSVKRAIHIHDPLLSRLFETARAHHFFAMDCQAPHSHVAFTGKKTLAYTGPDGQGACTFNYSHEQSLNQIANDLISVAYTLEEGTRLASEHLHDRLSLDGELESLQDAAQDRRALELGNIAPELESIANDDAVMNLARKRARALLIEPASLH
jgi:hypothetical protein